MPSTVADSIYSSLKQHKLVVRHLSIERGVEQLGRNHVFFKKS